MIIDLDYCEICGAHKNNIGLHDHHIKHRAAGGEDIEENVIKACGVCHAKCHAGNIKLHEQIEKVACRMGKTPEEICEAIGLLAEKVLPQDYVFDGQQNPLKGMSLEDVLQTYFSYAEVGEQAVWGKAQILSGMLDAGWKLKTVSSLVGCSPATIREHARTYKAFADESTRALDKSFTHHRIASKSDDPIKWIDMVCREDLSTRQLEEAIKAESKDETIVKDFAQEKAERVVRMVNEILDAPGDTADWLQSELKNILIRSCSNNETSNNSRISTDQTQNSCEDDLACAG